jgi:anti-sigma regulatory factor (Ser/Thr protein kinase)
MTADRLFANHPASVAQARQFARESLAGVSDEVLDVVALMVSELATNSVRHTDTDFTVSVDRENDEIRIAVTDSGTGLPAVQSPAPTDPSGRGLRIVEKLADDWGVTETAGRRGKTVWLTLSLRPHQPDASSRRSSSRT